MTPQCIVMCINVHEITKTPTSDPEPWAGKVAAPGLPFRSAFGGCRAWWLLPIPNSLRAIRVDLDSQLVHPGRGKFGSVIGDGAKTGVNASLNPGTALAPGAVVGAGAAASGWIEST